MLFLLQNCVLFRVFIIMWRQILVPELLRCSEPQIDKILADVREDNKC